MHLVKTGSKLAMWANSNWHANKLTYMWKGGGYPSAHYRVYKVRVAVLKLFPGAVLLAGATPREEGWRSEITCHRRL